MLSDPNPRPEDRILENGEVENLDEDFDNPHYDIYDDFDYDDNLDDYDPYDRPYDIEGNPV